MQDMIPKGTGNSRYLKSSIPESTTWQQFLTMLRNGTFPIDLNGINPSGITQEGTPLNKSTLFSDTTKARYPSGTETVDQALAATVLTKDHASRAAAIDGTDDTSWMSPLRVQQAVGDKLGDIKVTKRTNLGDKYLLCNGAKFDDNEYPNLRQFATHRDMLSSFDTKVISTTSSDSVNGVEYGNGYFVAYGDSSYNGYTVPTIWYTTNPRGTWTKKTLSTGSSSYERYEIKDVKYIKSTWIAVMGTTISSSGIGSRLWTATTPNGTWALRINNSYGGSYGLSNIAYDPSSGVLAVYGNSSDGSGVYTTTSPTGSWTFTKISYPTPFLQGKFKYLNGMWVNVAPGSSLVYDFVWIYYSSSPSGPFTSVQMKLPNTNITRFGCYDFEYFSGNYVFIGYSDNSDQYFPYAVYTNSLSKTTADGMVKLTTTTYTNPITSYAAYGKLIILCQVNNYSMVVLYSSSLTSGWTTKTLSSSYGGWAGGLVANDDEMLVVVFTGSNSSGSNQIQALTGEDGYFLPVVTLENAYCYIRGK